jgi:RNA polymerase sigma-32 factor
VARELKVKPEEVAEMEMRLAGQEVALEPSSDDDESYAPIAYLADRSPEPSEIVEARQEDALRTSGLESALASLDARSRRIIETRWLREKDSATLHELAAEFKVSAERIRQIEAKALEKMKGLIAA